METKQTSKEKALELIAKMYTIRTGSVSDISFYFAKKSALVAVNEILELEKARLIGGDINDVEYWEEVYKEIEKL
jgi:hypothetical protein